MKNNRLIKLCVAGVITGVAFRLFQEVIYETGLDRGRKSLINEIDAKLTRFETDEYGRPKYGTVIMGKHADGTLGYFRAKKKEDESEEES